MENRTEELKETIGRIINDAMYYILDEDDSRYLAEELIDKGYRKASEVAEDIIRMLRAGGINEWRYPIVADIKKKYTEGEG